jgi:OHCU decarboxylase
VIRVETLNSMPACEFVATLGGIFEKSPWVAERAVPMRPFASGVKLHEAMCALVQHASREEQLALIRAHPELAGRAAIRGELTPESTREQQGAGLSACSPEEFERLHALNKAYSARFDFPFILAVKGHTRESVIEAMERRLSHGIQEERAAALQEIYRIARFRLADLLGEPL